MPSHKLNFRDKPRNKFSLRSRNSDRRHRNNNNRPTNQRGSIYYPRGSVIPDEYTDYDYVDENNKPEKHRDSIVDSKIKHEIKDFDYLYKNSYTSIDYKSLEDVKNDHTESIKKYIDFPKSQDEEDHIRRPEPLDKSSVEMLTGEYTSFNEDVYHFNRNPQEPRKTLEDYHIMETSSIKNYEFDDHSEATGDTLNISDFSLNLSNDTEDGFDDSEKLIIVPSNIDIDEFKGNTKPKHFDEDFGNFNFDFEVKPYLDLSTPINKETSTSKYLEVTTPKTEEISTFSPSNDIQTEEISKIEEDLDYDFEEQETTTYGYKTSSEAYTENLSVIQHIKSTTTKPKILIDDEFDIVEDIEQLKNIEDEIVAQTIKDMKESFENPESSQNLFRNVQEELKYLENNTDQPIKQEEPKLRHFTVTQNPMDTSTYFKTNVDSNSQLFDSLDSHIIEKLFDLVKHDVEIKLPVLLNDKNYIVNFTKEHFDKVILEIHNDPILKSEFKEYLRGLVQNQSDSVIKENQGIFHSRQDSYNSSSLNHVKHFHIKKKELPLEEVQKDYLKVYQKVMLLSGYIQGDMDEGSGDSTNDSDFESFLDREMGDQPFSEISLALPSKKDANNDYYDLKETEEDLVKKNKLVTNNERNNPDRAIKTFDTPSGRVKILYQVNEKDLSKKEKDKNNVNVDTIKSDVSSVQNTGKFLHESEKHKVSAVVTSDGKIGILVKSKPKNIDHSLGSENYDVGSYPNPKLVPTKVSEGNDFSYKTTVLRPISGTEGIFGSDRTVLKPVGTNIWTAVRRENIKKTTTKTVNIGDIPYDDDYYDEDDTKIDTDGDQFNPSVISTELPIESSTLLELEHTEKTKHKLNSNKTNEVEPTDSIKNNLESTHDNKLKNSIRTFDEDFLRGLQRNTSDDRRERKPDFPAIKNHNSIDYRKSHDKSVYLNILDILGPDSKDVIQLLKDVKHINNDRSTKKQLEFNKDVITGDSERKSISKDENIPIRNKSPVEIPKVDTGMSDLDERILRKDNDEVFTDPYREREKNRVDFHLNKNLNNEKETDKDWMDEHTKSKNLDDIWSDNEEELAEDSKVNIVPVHTGHSIFQKINLNKPKQSQTETIPNHYDTKQRSTYSHMGDHHNTSSGSHNNFETFKNKLVLCFCIIFSFSFYTAFNYFRIHSWYNNIMYTHW